MTNIAIFVSGNGTNCENIIKYFEHNPDINVNLVISNRADAYALKRAENIVFLVRFYQRMKLMMNKSFYQS